MKNLKMKKEFKVIAELLPNNLRVLDVGCGDGSLMNLLEKENALVARLKRAREEGVDPDDLRDEDEEGGFKKEVYWVKHAGDNDLDIPMFLRPTSETAMYTMFPLWVRSHKDLPLKVYQMVNTFRYETKQTRSFIRVREIHFFEAHTVHADEECATRQIEQDLQIVDNLIFIYRFLNLLLIAEFASIAFLKTCEMIDKPLILSNGLPGNLVADNLDGIITNVFILFSI